MIIAHNLMAMNAQRQNKIVGDKKSKSSEKLSSGYKINRAADDAAGLSISEKMRKQIRGLARGVENTQDGVSLCQVADGALNEVTDMLHRMTELVIQAANGTNSVSDRQAIQDEINELRVEIDRIGRTTTFNQRPLFDGETKEPSAITRRPVSSDTMGTGYMTDIYQNNGRFYPAAVLDLSSITADNIQTLAGRSLSVDCVYGCGESCTLTFANGGGSSAENLKGYVEHKYTIDIAGLSSGQELINRITNIVNANPTASNPAGAPLNSTTIGDASALCHSVQMISNGNQLVFASENGYPTAANAAAAASTFSGNQARVDLSAFEYDLFIDWKINTTPNNFHIMPGNEPGSGISLNIDRMNSKMLGLHRVSAMSERQATDSISIINKALEAVTANRSKIGAYQNRLEYTIANESNIVENTQAAESRIRDTDMAKEMVNYSLQNILMQAGESMMAQANSSTQGVMNLLQ